MKQGFPASPMANQALVSKFASRIDFKKWDQCWDWTGHITDRGYGVFAPTKKAQWRAHRFSLEAYLGRPLSGMVLHSCDNRACVNPKHLSEGNHLENMSQMALRRRAARGPRHPRAKLTETKALAINVLHRGGDFSTRELATMFGMSQPTIAQIVSGRLWRDAHSLADAMIIERSQP